MYKRQAVYHEQNSGIIIHLTDDNGQGIQPGKLCSVLAAVPGDDLVAALWSGTGNQRRQHTILLDVYKRQVVGSLPPRKIWLSMLPTMVSALSL